MRFIERFKQQDIEKIILSPVLIIGLITFSLLVFHIYLNLNAPMILAAFIALLLGFVILVKPEIGLFIFMLIVLIEAHYFLDLPRFGFISMPIMLEVLMVSAVAFKIFVKKDIQIGKDVPIKIFGCYILWGILSTAFASSYYSFNMIHIKEISLALFSIFLMYTIIQSKSNIKNFFYVLIASNIIILASTLLIARGFIQARKPELVAGGIQRLTGFIQDPNSLSFHLIAFMIVSFSLFLYFKSKSLKSLFLIITILNLMGILFTLSRGGFVALVGVMLFIYFKFTRNVRVILILLLLSFLLYLVLPVLLIERFEELRSFEKVNRFILAKRGIYMTLDNPIFGVGLGNFGKYGMLYSDNFSLAGKAAHNMYLSISAQLGIPALIIYLLAFIIIWKKTTLIETQFRSKTYEGNFELVTALIIKVSLINILLMGLSLHVEHKFIVMFLLGLSISFIKLVNEEKKNKNSAHNRAIATRRWG